MRGSVLAQRSTLHARESCILPRSYSVAYGFCPNIIKYQLIQLISQTLAFTLVAYTASASQADLQTVAAIAMEHSSTRISTVEPNADASRMRPETSKRVHN